MNSCSFVVSFASVSPAPLVSQNAVAVLVSRKAEFQKALLAWFDVHQRSLPWRQSPSLYKTVVSEFMLQQTQVKTVLPYFSRWQAALPDFTTLAQAPEEQVLKLWEGLGYYSRARNLHRLAKALVALPAIPQTPIAWQELPGVGPYTAAAITSIALSVPAACVDGNVVRILARLTAEPTEYRDSASAAKAFMPLGSALVSVDRPGDHNQAMMELGATVCHRQSPLCTVCPVFSFCAAAQAASPEAYPRLIAKKMEQVTVLRAWVLHEGKLLLHRAGASAKRLTDLHELPTHADLELSTAPLPAATLLARKKRGITRYQITEYIYAIDLSVERRHKLSLNPTLHWVPLDQLEGVTLSGPHRRWVNELLAGLARPAEVETKKGALMTTRRN